MLDRRGGAEGRFQITYTEEDFRDLFELNEAPTFV